MSVSRAEETIGKKAKLMFLLEYLGLLLSPQLIIMEDEFIKKHIELVIGALEEILDLS